MKKKFNNFIQSAANKGCIIDRKQYLHVFLRWMAFDIDEIEDIVNPNYDLREFEKKNDFHCVKELLQPIIERKLKEIGYSKSKISYGEIERVEWDGEGLSSERAHKDIMVLYNSIMNADKTKWSKDEIDKALKIIKEYDEKFGLFNEDEKDKRKFDGHFFTVFKSLNAVCVCGHEIDICRGMLIQCPFCKVWIDTREDKKDYEKNIKVIAGEHGKNSIQQIEGEKCEIYYDNHYDDLK
jgi:hypothetical protein